MWRPSLPVLPFQDTTLKPSLQKDHSFLAVLSHTEGEPWRAPVVNTPLAALSTPHAWHTLVLTSAVASLAETFSTCLCTPSGPPGRVPRSGSRSLSTATTHRHTTVPSTVREKRGNCCKCLLDVTSGNRGGSRASTSCRLGRLRPVASCCTVLISCATMVLRNNLSTLILDLYDMCVRPGYLGL